MSDFLDKKHLFYKFLINVVDLSLFVFLPFPKSFPNRAKLLPFPVWGGLGGSRFVKSTTLNL
jgi:hypothetical protein